MRNVAVVVLYREFRCNPRYRRDVRLIRRSWPAGSEQATFASECEPVRAKASIPYWGRNRLQNHLDWRTTLIPVCGRLISVTHAIECRLGKRFSVKLNRDGEYR